MSSRRGYWLGTALIILGPAAATVLVVVSFATGEPARLGETRLEIPGQRTVRLEAGKYVVYYELPASRAGGDDMSSPPLQLDLMPVGGGPAVAVADYSTRLTVDSGGRTAVAVATVEPPAAGSYGLSVSTDAQDPGDTVVLGRPLGKRLAAVGAAAAALLVLPVVLGLALIIGTMIRRRRAGRSVGGTPPFTGGGPVPPSWPPSGGQQPPQGWPPPHEPPGPPQPPQGWPAQGDRPMPPLQPGAQQPRPPAQWPPPEPPPFTGAPDR